MTPAPEIPSSEITPSLPGQIFLVDDEVELTQSLHTLLARQGYHVDVATDGTTALAQLQQASPTLAHCPYDLLILDWMLPGVSGVQLCQALRQAGNPVPVLFLTAKDTLNDRVTGLDAGADDYLVKPFELRELQARVRALLRRSPRLANLPPPPDLSEPLQVADLELDLPNQVAYWHQQAISLSAKECQLLACLMQHPGQLLTRQDISDQLWPHETQPSSNVLAAHIRLLRRKLEAPTPDHPPLIQAVYGKGYRLVLPTLDS